MAYISSKLISLILLQWQEGCSTQIGVRFVREGVEPDISKFEGNKESNSRALTKIVYQRFLNNHILQGFTVYEKSPKYQLLPASNDNAINYIDRHSNLCRQCC